MSFVESFVDRLWYILRDLWWVGGVMMYVYNSRELFGLEYDLRVPFVRFSVTSE